MMNESKNPASRGPTSTQPTSGLSAPSATTGDRAYAGSSAGRPGMAGSTPRYGGGPSGQTTSGYSSSGSPAGYPGSTPESLRTDHTAYSASSHAHVAREDSVPGLIRGLAHDLTTLFSKEVSLAKAEMREAAAGMKKGLSSMAVGGGLAFSGLLVLLFSAVYGLATVMALWLSALIVGAVSLLIGYALIKSGSSKMEPGAFVPERTLHELEQDKETAKEAVK